MRVPSTAAKPAKYGRREGNKAEKLRRISAAARELFAEKGFDGATMRDIARRAEVGFGTLFDYASNKRDLLFLIFNPELDQVLDQALADAAAEAKLIDRLMALFSNYYALFAREKRLSRMVLRELTFFSEGGEAQKFLDHRHRFMGAAQLQITIAIADGEIVVAEPDTLARLVFAVYAWEVRRWLSTDTASVARGLTELRALLAMQLSGFRQPVAIP